MQARKDLAKGSVSFSDDKGQEKGQEKSEESAKALPAPPTDQAGATAAVTLDRAYAKVTCSAHANAACCNVNLHQAYAGKLTAKVPWSMTVLRFSHRNTNTLLRAHAQVADCANAKEACCEGTDNDHADVEIPCCKVTHYHASAKVMTTITTITHSSTCARCVWPKSCLARQA